MSANSQNRHARTSRLARKLAVAGTGAAVLALPLIGATSASAATPAAATTATAAATTYPDNLDGWIRESLDIMAQHGINAVNGTPSKGLLQVIDPTFQAYHVPGTSWDPYDPVANITAACNYAADRYGSMDNVFGAY
jgi:hypothetical protein